MVFSALSVIYFFSFVVNILFHYDIVQWLTLRIGWLLRKTIGEEDIGFFLIFKIIFNIFRSFFFNRDKIGTSTVESMNAASNIFLGQAMAPLLIKVNYRSLPK